MSDIDRNRLTEKFPKSAIRQREAVRGGKKLDYVEGHTVIHRLNDAVKSWDFAIKDLNTSVIGRDGQGQDIVLLRAHVALTIPGMGTREHVGVQAVRANSGEDLVKGAVTDALKKAATLFGVGLELYGPDYEDHLPSVWDAHDDTPSSLPKVSPKLGMLYGATKDLGHTVPDSQGHLHHDEQWLTNEAAQFFNLGGNPNFSGSEDLTDQQIDELITEFRSRQKARLNKPVELHPGVSPSKQVPPISDWTAFWRFANANGYTKEKVQSLNGGSLPSKVKDALDLLIADMERRPHLINNQVG